MGIHSAAVTLSQCWPERQGRGRGSCGTKEVLGGKGPNTKRKGGKKEEKESERVRERERLEASSSNQWCVNRRPKPTIQSYENRWPCDHVAECSKVMAG